MAIKKGVSIAFGIDADVYPYDNTNEFPHTIEAVWSPLFALRIVTITNVELLGIEGKIEQLKEGFIADIITVDKDLMGNISSRGKRDFCNERRRN